MVSDGAAGPESASSLRCLSHACSHMHPRGVELGLDDFVAPEASEGSLHLAAMPCPLNSAGMCAGEAGLGHQGDGGAAGVAGCHAAVPSPGPAGGCQAGG